MIPCWEGWDRLFTWALKGYVSSIVDPLTKSPHWLWYSTVALVVIDPLSCAKGRLRALLTDYYKRLTLTCLHSICYVDLQYVTIDSIWLTRIKEWGPLGCTTWPRISPLWTRPPFLNVALQNWPARNGGEQLCLSYEWRQTDYLIWCYMMWGHFCNVVEPTTDHRQVVTTCFLNGTAIVRSQLFAVCTENHWWATMTMQWWRPDIRETPPSGIALGGGYSYDLPDDLPHMLFLGVCASIFHTVSKRTLANATILTFLHEKWSRHFLCLGYRG